MNAAKNKKQKSSAAGYVAGFFPAVSGFWRKSLVSIVLVAALAGASYYGWNRWGAQIIGDGNYALKAEDVHVTPLPIWIRSDVRAEVIRDGGLIGLSLLDPQLTVEVGQAFALHSWVQNVSRVSKDAKEGVMVELTYRKPVAMVEVVMNDKPGLLPIDADGVLLPPQDFTPDETRDYLRISVPQATPTGPVGTAWGQTDVHESARIATVFLDQWKKCGLYRIQLVPATTPDSTRIQPTFELQSRNGARVIWGRAPDIRSEADTKAAMIKVARVLKYVEANGTLDSANTSTQIDLRGPEMASAETGVSFH